MPTRRSAIFAKADVEIQHPRPIRSAAIRESLDNFENEANFGSCIHQGSQEAKFSTSKIPYAKPRVHNKDALTENEWPVLPLAQRVIGTERKAVAPLPVPKKPVCWSYFGSSPLGLSGIPGFFTTPFEQATSSPPPRTNGRACLSPGFLPDPYGAPSPSQLPPPPKSKLTSRKVVKPKRNGHYRLPAYMDSPHPSMLPLVPRSNPSKGHNLPIKTTVNTASDSFRGKKDPMMVDKDFVFGPGSRLIKWIGHRVETTAIAKDADIESSCSSDSESVVDSELGMRQHIASECTSLQPSPPDSFVCLPRPPLEAEIRDLLNEVLQKRRLAKGAKA